METYDLDLTWKDPEGKTTHISGQLDVETTEAPDVSVPPTITTEPAATTLSPGQTAVLTVVAEGTAPLDYQWFQDAHAIPGATSATYQTPPLSTSATYHVEVSNVVGTVTSKTVTVTVVPITPTVGLGLTYVRTIALPPCYMAYSYGDLAGRIVNDRVHLVTTGDWVNVMSPVYEFEITDAPVATFVQEWTDPYKGKRGTWVQSAALFDTADALHRWADDRARPDLHLAADWYFRLAQKIPKGEWYWLDFSTTSTPALNAGHYYHPEHDLLYVTYSDSYNVAGRPDWNCLAIRLHADGTSECWGPWRLTCTDGDGNLRYGPRAALLLRPHPTAGTILSCTSLTSGNIGCPWGGNLVGGAAWPTETTPTGPEAPDVHLADCELYSYYMGGAIDPQTGVASGPVRSMRRPLHPYVHEGFAEANQLNFVNPEAYGGIGSWTDNDSLGGFEPLPDRTYFFAGVAGSPSQVPTDPHAAHVFYANGANAFKCTHGIDAVPAGITGPTSTARFPAAFLYQQADFDRVRGGDVADWQIEPTAWSNLEQEFGIVTAPIDAVGCAKQINGGFFDRRSRLLYLIAHGADRGVTTWGLVLPSIHVFRVD